MPTPSLQPFEDEIIDVKKQSLFSRLKSLFSTEVIVRNVGGKQIKIKDTNNVMFATDRNSLRDRFNRIRSTAYNAYSRDFALSYQAARMDLFRDYDCVGPDTIIPLPDGNRPTIRELSEKYKDQPQERFWVFSYDHVSKSIKLGKAFHPRKKKGTRMGYKVTFDNGQYVIGSLKHPFLMRNGEYKKIVDLKVGESVMPFYQKDFYGHGYRHIYNFSKGWQSEHKIVAEQFDRPLKYNEVVHHKNFDKNNNLPNNLQIMTESDHKAYHCKIISDKLWSPENKQNTLDKIQSSNGYKNRLFHKWNGERKGKNNPFYGKIHSDESNENRSETLKKVFVNRDQNGKKNPKYRNDLTIEVLKLKAIEHYKKNGKLISWDLIKDIGCDYSVLQNRLTEKFTNWKSFKKEVESTLNHTIVSIESIGQIDVYDVTVEKFANFATDSCIVKNTMDMDPILSSALDIYADECLTYNEMGKMLTVHSSNNNVKEILENLYNDILNVQFNMWSWTRNMPVKYDSYIPLLSGENIRIDDLSNKIKNGEGVWVYSVQDGTNQIVPGKVVWCDKNYTANKIVKITFDDNSFVETSPEHPFILRNGIERCAEDLKENDSLMPFYRKLSPEKGGMNKYEMIYNPGLDKYDFTHRNVAESYGIKTDSINRILHHKNFNKYDNSPTNLIPMEFFDHRRLHADHCKRILHTPEIIEKRKRSIDKYLRSDKIRSKLKTEMWKDPVRRERACENMKSGWTSDRRESASKKMKELRKNGILPNHKVKTVEIINESSDVYCMTVVGPNGEHDRHNFAMCGKDLDGNITKDSGVFVKNCKYGDFYLKLYITPEYGVYMVEPISSYNVERIENADPNNKRYVKFQLRPTDTAQAEVLENYEMAHFRLMSDSNFMPYGKSMLEGARRVWKQLSLMEDAMLIHRIMRAPEKRIFYTDIGNIPPAEVDNYMQKMMDKMKKVPYMDEQSGEYNLRFNLQNMVEDYYIPVRGSDSGTKIDTLGGMEWTGTEDIEYLRNKLMSALKIPKAFLGYEEGISGKATLASEDVRFARTIQRIQRIIANELEKIGIVHLYAQGYRDESLVDFKLELTNPSTIFEKEKLEIWSDKVSVSTDMIENKFFSYEWVYKNIFHMSDDDIKEVKDQVVEDSKQKYRFSKIEEDGDDPAKPFNKIGIGKSGGSEKSDSGGGGGLGGGLGGGGGGGGGGLGDIEDLEGKPGEGEGGEGEGGEGEGEDGKGDEETPPGETKNKEEPEDLVKEIKQKRDQSGEHDARAQHPFGEDPLGSKERLSSPNKNSEGKRKSNFDHNFENDSPFSLKEHRLSTVSMKENKDLISNLSVFLKKSQTDVTQELISENSSKSLMDESNIIHNTK